MYLYHVHCNVRVAFGPSVCGIVGLDASRIVRSTSSPGVTDMEAKKDLKSVVGASLAVSGTARD